MGELRPLREAGGSRGVEDARIVVGIDVDGRQLGRRGCRVDHVIPTFGVIGQFTVVANRHQCQRSVGAQFVEHGEHPLDTFAVRDQAPSASSRTSPYFISSDVHQAFIPTTAAPIEMIAQ